MPPSIDHEITIPGERDVPPASAFAVLPGEAARGVVGTREIFGRGPATDARTRRLGRAGYAGVALDVFIVPARGGVGPRKPQARPPNHGRAECV